MQKGQYIVIKVEDIDKRIKELESKKTYYQDEADQNIGKILALEEILSNPKDLYDIVEDIKEKIKTNNP